MPCVFNRAEIFPDRYNKPRKIKLCTRRLHVRSEQVGKCCTFEPPKKPIGEEFKDEVGKCRKKKKENTKVFPTMKSLN